MARIELQCRLLDRPWKRGDGRWHFQGSGLRILAGRETRVSGCVRSLPDAVRVLGRGDVINVWGRLQAPGEVAASRINVDHRNIKGCRERLDPEARALVRI